MARIVITGGGTGGHLYPALAVAEALKADGRGHELLYIGNANRTEAQLVPEHGIAFEGLLFSGMPRGLSLKLPGWTLQLVQTFGHARSLLARFKPDVVFGTGGYVTAPVLIAARTLGIPIVLHEPDAYPGLVNRMMARHAAAMTCAFEAARPRLHTNRLRVTGNPLRQDIGQLSRKDGLKRLNLPLSPDRPVLLVTGGSQGARTLNQAVLTALPGLIDELGLQVLHQSGQGQYETVVAECPEAFRQNPAYQLFPFFNDMAACLAVSDLAVCRAGSMTLSELYRSHLPTLLVPYPYAAADHQRQNALASQAAGASLMIEDAKFTGPVLVDTMRSWLSQPETRQAMVAAAKRLATPQATQDVIAVLLQVARGSHS